MKFKISKDRKTLTISVDKKERKLLREGWDCPGATNIQSDKAMAEFFEPLIANSELQWLPEGATSDLTSAPMLGILGDEMPARKINQTVPRHYGMIQCGFWNGKAQFQPILERWAFLDYALRSPLEDLRDKGVAIFNS